MFITNEDFLRICAAYELLPEGDAFNSLPQYKQDIIVNAGVTILKLMKKKKAENERAKKYIAKKRAVNKDYGRKKRKEKIICLQ